jgi:hypothetical protein
MSEEREKHVIVKMHPDPDEYIEAETAFLRAVGLCITQWAFIDRQLFRLFKQGVGAPTQRAAIVYYDQYSISTHLRQVDELLERLLEGDDHKELRKWWKEIREKLYDLLPTRNVIAHQPVRRVGTSDGKRPVYIYGIHLEPYRRFLKKHLKGLKGKDALTTEDLIAHSEAVDKLWFELANFAKKIVATFRDRRTWEA